MFDNLPVASLTFLAGLVIVVIGAIVGDISLDDAFEYLALLGAGSFGIGYVRNQAGRGISGRR